MPERIQRKRTRGYRMPPNTLYVGRPTKWGMGNGESAAAEVVARYRRWVTDSPEIEAVAIRELRGKNLACWCPIGQPCHADVLLEIANR